MIPKDATGSAPGVAREGLKIEADAVRGALDIHDLFRAKIV